MNCPASSVELLSEPLRWLTALEAVAPADSFLVGTWLSLVEHSLGVRGVGSSNLPVPTIHTKHAFPLRILFPAFRVMATFRQLTLSSARSTSSCADYFRTCTEVTKFR